MLLINPAGYTVESRTFKTDHNGVYSGSLLTWPSHSNLFQFGSYKVATSSIKNSNLVAKVNVDYLESPIRDDRPDFKLVVVPTQQDITRKGTAISMQPVMLKLSFSLERNYTDLQDLVA